MIDLSLIYTYLPLLLSGLRITLAIAGISCLLGMILGTFLAIIQTQGPSILRAGVAFYVTIIRGTPMLIQILFAFNILPVLGIVLAPFWIATCAISLNSAAYISQIIRSGIQSIAKGQREAAKTLGLSTQQTLRYIVLPQALQVVLPALGNEFITLTKDSSLASIIGVMELSKQGRLMMSRTYDALSAFFAVGILYLVITTTLSIIVSRIEQRMKHVNH